MAVKKLNKQNCVFLYGDDLVSMNIRKDGLLSAYFHGQAPDPTVFDGTGSYEEYENALAGQSLFSSDTAVVIHNPFFLKRISKSEKEEKRQEKFLDTLKNLPPEIFLLIMQDGKIDKRTKIGKGLLAICYSEELSLMKPRDAAGVMTRMLSDAGKRVDFNARGYLEEVLSSWEGISRPLLQTECDKIVLMCGSSDMVTKHILELALPDYMNQGIFPFVDALLDKKASLVLERADRVFTDTSTTIKNLGFLSYKFRQIKMLKELSRARVPVMRMQQMMGIRNSWAWKSLLRDGRKVSEADAEWMLKAIFTYEFNSRQGSSELDLKDLLLRYCMR